MQINIELPQNWEMQIEYLSSGEHDVRVYAQSRLVDAKSFDDILDAVIFAYSFDFDRELNRRDFNEKINLYADTVRSLAKKELTDSDKRQPIKEQTLDEFNNARQVAYGSNVQVESLTDNDFIITTDRVIFTNPETGEQVEVGPTGINPIK